MGLPASMAAATTFSWTEAVTITGARATAVFQHFKTGKTFSSEGVESSGQWTFTINPEDTADLPPGQYSTALIVQSDSAGRTQTNGSAFKLLPAIDKEPEETHAARMVQILEAHIEGRMHDGKGRGIETHTVNGTPITKIPVEQARMLLEKYRKDMQAEESARRSAAGLSSGRTIRIEF